MFEGSKQAYEGFLQGQVNRQARDLRETTKIAHELVDTAMAQKRRAEAAEARVEALEAEVERLKLALAVKTAQSEGRGAMTKAYAAQHPDSPLRADTGKRYKDGDIKRRITLVFEQAHDVALVAKAKELGIAISNPADYRAD